MSVARLPGLLAELRWRGLVHDVSDGLEARLASGQPIRAYNGFDPTFHSLHAGHLVPIFGLIRLQRFGGQPVALVGGGTGLIGDPSFRSADRPLLDRPRMEANVHAIRGQLAHFLDFSPGPTQAVMVNNLDWLGDLRLIEFLRDVGKHFTIPYMLGKDSVQARLDRGLSFTEFSYMLLQAADFAHLHRAYGVELQCGGADQWGNITAGLELIRRTAGRTVASGGPGGAAAPDREVAYGLSYPLLLAPSGSKFGKSEAGESIWLDPTLTSPYRFYQYWLDVDDRDAGVYLRWFTLFDRPRVEELDAATLAHPEAHEAQRALARDVTERTHGRSAVERVVRVSELLFGGDPTAADPLTLADTVAEIPSAAWPEEAHSLDAVQVLVTVGAAASRGEARRLVEQGGVHVNGRPVADAAATFSPDDLLAGRYLLVRRGRRDQRALVRGAGPS